MRKLISLISQDDDTGCGIACVAMLSGVSYKEAKLKLFRLMQWTDRRINLRTRACDLRKLSQSFNLKPVIRSFSGWDNIDGCAIIGIRRSKRSSKRNFHWVVTLKTPHAFLILDPEYGDVFQGEAWAEDEGWFIGRKSSQYLSFPNLTFSGIKI